VTGRTLASAAAAAAARGTFDALHTAGSCMGHF
jgi:hypothetical protein